MGKKWPSEDVQESTGTMPAGRIKLKIEGFDEAQTKDSDNYMIVAHLRALEPKGVRNLPFTENFVIGKDGDREADDPKTWRDSVGARRFKTMLKKAGCRLSDDLAKQFRLATDCEFGAVVTNEVEEEGKYKGNIRARIARMFAVGERSFALDEDNGAPTDKPAKPAPKRNVEEDEEDENDEEDEDDEDEEDKSEKRPTRSGKSHK